MICITNGDFKFVHKRWTIFMWKGRGRGELFFPGVHHFITARYNMELRTAVFKKLREVIIEGDTR